MDSSLTYSKTAEGERAVRERTRLVQRNLRLVLILVDRHSSLADLKAKIGNAVLVEDALTELERMGLIERYDNSSDRDNPPSNEFLQADSSQYSDEPGLAGPVAAVTADSAWPTTETEQSRSAPAANEFLEPLEEELAAVAVEFNGPSEGAARPMEKPPQLPERRISAAVPRLWLWRERRVAAREERAFEQVYFEETAHPVRIKPIRSGERRRGGGVLPVVALLIFLAVPAIALLFPYHRYIPEIEVAATDYLHSPVHIQDIRMSMTPFPNLTLLRVEIGGEKPYATIGEVRLLPDPLSISSGTPVIKIVELATVRLHSAGISGAKLWFSDANAGLRLRHTRLIDFGIDFGRDVAAGLNGELIVGPQGNLAKIVLRSDVAEIEAMPSTTGFHLELASDAMVLPGKPPLQIFSLAGAGELSPQQLRLTKMNALIYDGRVEGTGSFEWSNGASVVGDLEFKRISVSNLLAAIKTDSSMEGDLLGKIHAEAQASTIAGLADALRIDGSLVGQRIVLNRFGLGEAVISTSREPTRSGTTKFDRVEATVQYDGNVFRLGNLSMSSRGIHAAGQASIARASGKLDGMLQVELKRSAMTIDAPVSLSGSLAFPELKRR